MRNQLFRILFFVSCLLLTPGLQAQTQDSHAESSPHSASAPTVAASGAAPSSAALKKENVKKTIEICSFRNGTITKCNGNEKNTVEFNRYVYHRVKFGLPMLVISICENLVRVKTKIDILDCFI